MNAYELADEVDSITKDWLGQNTSGKLSTMLRQQADRIAELEKALSRALDLLEGSKGEVNG